MLVAHSNSLELDVIEYACQSVAWWTVKLGLDKEQCCILPPHDHRTHLTTRDIPARDNAGGGKGPCRVLASVGAAASTQVL